MQVTAAQLLDIPSAAAASPVPSPTPGVRANISVGVRYLEAWLRGSGRRRASTTSWRTPPPPRSPARRSGSGSHQSTVTAEGTRLTRARILEVLDEVVAGLPRDPQDRVDDAVDLFAQVALADEFPTFLTVPAYTQYLVERGDEGA